MATMQDVADRAGVSLSTVSYAITGKRSISHATRERVHQAMAELNFTPNATARALAARQTQVLAVAYPAFGLAIGSTINSIVAAAAQRARDHGYTVVMWPASSRESDTISDLAAGQSADAVILLEVSLEDPRVAAVEAHSIPCGLIGRTSDPGNRPWADMDWDATMTRAVDHLVALGHEHIALIGRDQAAIDAGYGPAVRGIESYRRAMAAHGLEPISTACDLTPAAGHQAVQALRTSHPRITAFMVMNELALFGVTAALQEATLRVPQDVSLLAIAVDSEIANLFEPPLSHLRPPAAALGAQAVDDVLSVLSGSPPPEGSLMPCDLVDTTTTGPVPHPIDR